MASNKIGIEVQVEFPTVAELQRQLAEKWKSVKNGFEGKINIAVDGHSLNRVKKQIQTALDGKDFHVNVDGSLAIGEIGRVRKELNNLDDQLNKVRDVKIQFKVGDMDKSMKELIEANLKLQKGTDNVKDKNKVLNSELQKQVGIYDKIARKYKLIDGKKITTQIKTTRIEEGDKIVRTINPNGITEEKTNDVLGKREALLKEIHDVMKVIHKKEMDLRNASDDHAKIINNSLKSEKELLDTLKNQYSQKYKTFALTEDSSKELKAQQELEKAIKDQLEFEKLLSQEQKEQIADVQKLIALEQKIHSLKMSQVTANKGELDSLRDQIGFYENIHAKVQDTLTGDKKITAEQEEQLGNLRTINELELSRANEKKRQQAIDAKTAQDQREAHQKVLADLKEIHSLNMRIEEIETRRDQGGAFGNREQVELKLLQQQLRVKADIAQKNRELFSDAGVLTDETKEQLGKLQQINTAELNRVHNATQILAQNDKITAEAQKQEQAFKEVLEIEKNIARLQRDMIFTGMRERDIIERAIGSEREKADQMTNQLRIAGKITAEREKEIQKIREAQRQESRLADARQNAREKDQQFNDAGGLIDPYSTYANGRQAFDAILQPMKEIDESFYQVAKVADSSDLAMQNFKDTAFDVGTTLGTTASEYMMAVEKWVTAGKTFEESQHLGQVSQIGAFVGNISPDEMVKYMSVPLNAFEETGIKAEDIINSMNEVANNNAIEMNDLGKAYVRSATTAKNAGASFAELNGMIAAAQEATRKGGERIGTGIKTIGLNISAIQSRFSADNIKKHDFLESIGIDMEDAEGEAKSMTDIIEDLSASWDDLGKTDRANAVIMLAGKEHAETLQAIIDEWQTVQKVIEETNDQMNMGKDGSAYIEFAKQSDSLRFKLAELKNMWDKLMVSLGESDGAMAKVLDALISGLKTLVTLSQNPAVMAMLKAIAGILVVHAGANGIRRVWDTLSTGLRGQIKAVADIGLAWRNVRREVDLATGAVGRFDLAERGAGNNGAPNIVGGVGGNVITNNTPYKDKDGKDLRDRNGNLIIAPDLDRPSDYRDKNGSELRDRDGNRIHDVNNYDTRRYKDSNGNELLDRQGNPIVNPDNDKPKKNTPDVDGGKSTKAMGGVVKSLGKVLTLVPLLGDALILLEIAGVPVFDTIGEGFNKMFQSTKDQLAETEKLIEKFKGSNELINGTVDANRNKIENLQDDLGSSGVAKVDKNGDPVLDESGNLQTGESSSMGEEAFAKFKADFNAQAEAMGLVDADGVPIKITMNDTTHILEAMKLLNAEKLKLEQEAQVKVGQQISKDTTKLGDQEGKVAKAKLEYDQALERAENAKLMMASLKDANGEIVDQEMYSMWKAELDSANKHIEKTETELGDVSDAYEKTRKAIGDNARALLDEGEAYSASGLSKQEAKDTTTAMLNEYKKLNDETDTLANLQKELGGDTEIADEAFQELIKRFPEYENKGKDVVEQNGEMREELAKLVKAEQEKMDKTIEGAEVALATAGEQAGMQEVVKGAIESSTGATEESKDAVSKLNKEIKDIPAEKSFKARVSTVFSKGWDELKSWWGRLQDGISSRGAEIKASTSSSFYGQKGNNSVQVGSTRTTRTGRSSSSVATGTNVKGVGKAVSNRSTATGDSSARVSDEVWRYWGTNRKQDTLESALRDLERAVTLAKDDYAKVISNLTKKLPNLQIQQSNQRTLLSQKDSEMNGVLNNLKKYGFNVNTSTNSISNLSHAKNLKGEKAEEAEKLLQSFNSLTSEMISITDRVKDLSTQIDSVKEEIKQAKIAKEFKDFEKQLKRITAVMTSVTNADSLNNTKVSLVSGQDKELGLKVNEEALAKSKTNMSSLIKEFNELSLKTVNYKENGEQLKATLDSLGQQILAQADNIMKYRQAINDLEFARITEDMQKFNNVIGKQGSKLTNNIDNLKEGLLSGTDFNDLASAKDELLDLSRDNQYEKDAQERINLEKEVQDALDAYAKKNIDRATNVSNATLDVNAQMYNQLLTMQKDYTNGNKVKTNILTAVYGDLDDIASIDAEYAKVARSLEKFYEDVRKKEEALTKKYNEDMAKAKNPLERESLTDQFVLDSLDIEKAYFEAQIKANNKAIEELNAQLADASDDDKVKIQEQIAQYEQGNIDAQNRIKDSIKARFDFEKSIMDEVIGKYNDARNALQSTLELLNSLGVGNYEGKGTVLDAILDIEKNRNAQIKKNIADLQTQQGLYEVGSYEWNIINDQLAQYNQQLNESNRQLIDMNKNILANSFSETTSELQKSLFGGKTHDAWQQHQQLWMETLEKEIALEKMYKRMADLGTTVNKEKLDLLAKQEKLSRFEMDYLNKQLDIIELQEKVDNLSKQKTVQVLTQNEFGQWDWSYEADATQLDKAKDDLLQAELALQKMEEKAREDYLAQLNKILQDAQNGNYESVDDFRKAMEELGEAFDTAVGDIPEIGDDYINDLVEAYAKFVTENAGVVEGNPVDSYLVQATATMTDEIKKTFTDISKELGEIFANAILAVLPPSTSASANESKAISSQSTAISIEKIEFPNATNKDEIQEAILSLPQLALQKSKSK